MNKDDQFVICVIGIIGVVIVCVGILSTINHHIDANKPQQQQEQREGLHIKL